MAMRQPIPISPESDTAELLERANAGPLIVELAGRRYRIVREGGVTQDTYDPDAAREALRNAFGALKGFDVDRFKKDNSGATRTTSAKQRLSSAISPRHRRFH